MTLPKKAAGALLRAVAGAFMLQAGILVPAPVDAQWTHRYPKVEGYSHHVYLEGYELPTLTGGPFDPAPAPDGNRLAFAARGWLWVLDTTSGVATRVTNGPGVDARPAWSPDGSRLAFVRDHSDETEIVILDLDSGTETVAVAEPGIDLDPAFSADGRWLYHTSIGTGGLDLWRLDLASWQREPVTTTPGVEREAQPLADGSGVVFLRKRGEDAIVHRGLADSTETALYAGRILSQTGHALAPDGRTLAFTRPVGDDDWELALLDRFNPVSRVHLVSGRPLTPGWSPDGSRVYYAEADDDEAMALWSVAAAGGEPARVEVRGWEWSAPVGVVRIRTFDPEGRPVPARLSVTDGAGHPLVAAAAQPRFDGQTGRVFAYSDGVLDFEAPAGEVRAMAVRGLATVPAVDGGAVPAGDTLVLDLVLEPLWNAAAAGWAAGDHHFHLNYGGPYRLDPEDLLLQLRAEDVDVATPLVANLHDRFGEQRFWGWERSGDGPWVHFGQEVRSHFLGHVSLIGAGELFWPWVWGPGYQVYGRDDRPNADALRFGRDRGGLGTYVHPVSRPGPFSGVEDAPSVPLELIADAALGDLDAIEVVCLWTDEMGTSDLWHRLLTIGRPVAANAGTDVMANFYRTMGVGTARVYVRAPREEGMAGYLEALRAGRSFVTTGPWLDFRLDGAAPGDAVPADGAGAWTLDLRSAVPIDRVEVLVNGEVVWSDGGGVAPGASRTLSGTVTLPAGGWVAARAVGPPTTEWPAMNSYGFAHSSPIWIDSVGSRDTAAASRAATELLTLLDAGEARLRAGYEGTPIPRLLGRFEEARGELQALIREED
ncbi:MAG TPA: CehA/McbA family metallohydrolase [Longimicrobiales bacterium]|nr:CehA/McbA family metallohydrolase [Longimicrobiales bacterium]